MNRRTEGHSKVNFWNIPVIKNNLFKSKILKEEITLEIKMQFDKNVQLFLTNHKYCYICLVLSKIVAIALFFIKGRKEERHA
jgi:hypothetical protein